MAELKTQRNKASVKAFIDAIEDDARRKDCRAVMKMMKEVTGKRPEMWGESIVGYGTQRQTYASGRVADWMEVGFSPRKGNLTLYIMSGFTRFDGLMKKLGKHKTGKSCLYIKSLDDIDRDVLHQLIEESITHVRERSG